MFFGNCGLGPFIVPLFADISWNVHEKKKNTNSQKKVKSTPASEVFYGETKSTRA